MKKKIVILSVLLLLLVGCGMSNTPTSKVEELLMKYQKVDSDISAGINDVIAEQNFTEDHANRYRDLLTKQYKNLSYEVKDEVIDGNNATVTVQIEVIDYKNAIGDLTFDSSIYTKETYDEEKLYRLENAGNKVTYTLDLTLTKGDDGVWKLNALTNEQIKKIQGMF
mgnify:CR=1 FL=1